MGAWRCESNHPDVSAGMHVYQPPYVLLACCALKLLHVERQGILLLRTPPES